MQAHAEAVQAQVDWQQLHVQVEQVQTLHWQVVQVQAAVWVLVFMIYLVDKWMSGSDTTNNGALAKKLQNPARNFLKSWPKRVM